MRRWVAWVLAVGGLVGAGVATTARKAPDTKIPAKPTFSRDVAKIVFTHCTPCHRAGEAGPFPLVSYKDVASRGAMIKASVQQKLMPPWKAVHGYGDFARSRALSPLEIGTIARWVEQGCRQGDPKLAPPAPRFTAGWQLGKPDLILEVSQEFPIKADGPDTLQNFVLPANLTEDKVVSAIELRPGNPKVTHHALVFLDNSGAARKLDAATKEPGYASFGGPGFFPSGSLGGWAPGGSPVTLPDGIGRYFAKGSDVVLQIHYHPTGKPEKDRSKIGIYFAKKPVTRLVGGIALENWDIKIEPGQKQYKRTATYTLPTEATFLTVTPHMHLLGREMRADATTPDGKKVPLVWVKDWDFRWQETFVYRAPLRLPKGTRLDLTSYHDNSAANGRNPFDPPRKIVYGEGSNDEMSLCIFEVTTDQIGDLLNLIADDSRHRQVVERAIRAYKPK